MQAHVYVVCVTVGGSLLVKGRCNIIKSIYLYVWVGNFYCGLERVITLICGRKQKLTASIVYDIMITCKYSDSPNSTFTHSDGAPLKHNTSQAEEKGRGGGGG